MAHGKLAKNSVFLKLLVSSAVPILGASLLASAALAQEAPGEAPPVGAPPVGAPPAEVPPAEARPPVLAESPTVEIRRPAVPLPPKARKGVGAQSDMDMASDEEGCGDPDDCRKLAQECEASHPGDARCKSLHLAVHLGALPAGLRGPLSGILGLRGRLEPHALLQTQAALMTGEDNQQSRGDRAENPGFTMRRARFGLSGGWWPAKAQFGLYVDAVGNPQSQAGMLSEAWFSIEPWRTGQLVVGAHRTPFSKTAMLSSGHLALAERAISTVAMAPFRQVGATLSGEYDLAGLQWHLGVYNSFERGANFHEGFREFSGITGNRFGGLSAVARVAAAPAGRVGSESFDAHGGDLRFEVGASAYTSDAATVRMMGFEGDVHLKWNGLHLLAEVLQDQADPKDKPTLPATLTGSVARRAAIAELGYTRKWYNLAVRFEQIDPNTDRDDDQDERVISAALGVQAPNQKVRAQLQFDHRQEVRGIAVDNDTLFLQFQLML